MKMGGRSGSLGGWVRLKRAIGSSTCRTRGSALTRHIQARIGCATPVVWVPCRLGHENGLKWGPDRKEGHMAVSLTDGVANFCSIGNYKPIETETVHQAGSIAALPSGLRHRPR